MRECFSSTRESVLKRIIRGDYIRGSKTWSTV